MFSLKFGFIVKHNHLDVYSAITVNIRSRIRCNNFIFFIPFIKAKLISTNIMYELGEMTPLPIQVTLSFLHLTVKTIKLPQDFISVPI